tara:strand:- start:158 stop:565 length:408 start_codon:yes stop_codon:yes gene_type:complete
MKTLTTLLLTLLILGGCSGEAKFEEDCSLFGGGKLECSIRNIGTKKGSICIQVSFYRMNFYDFYEDVEVRDEQNAVSFNKMCTNLIEPLDMQTKTKQMTFFDKNSEPYFPYQLCRHKGDEDDWGAGCLVNFIQVP